MATSSKESKQGKTAAKGDKGASTAPAAAIATGNKQTTKEKGGAVDPKKAHFGPSLAGQAKPAVYLPGLNIPDFKHAYGAYKKAGRTYFHAANYQRKTKDANPEQISVWNSAVLDATAISKLRAIGMTDGKPYLVTGQSGKFQRVADTVEDVAKSMRRPFWDATGKIETGHDVDHILELQLGGWPRVTDDLKHISNLELLDAASNRSSGSTIAQQLDAALDAALDKPDFRKTAPKGQKLDRNTLLLEHDIVFLKFNPIKATGAMSPPSHWSLTQINDGAHIDAITKPGSVISFFDLRNPAGGTPFKPHHLTPEEAIGSAKTPVIYLAGVKRVQIRWPKEKETKRDLNADEAKALGLAGASLELDFGSPGGSDIRVENAVLRFTKDGQLWAYQKQKAGLTEVKPFKEFKLRRLAHTTYAWVFRIPGITNEKGSIKGLSEISFGPLDFDGQQFFVAGQIRPSLKVLENVPIDILLRGDELVVQASFSAKDLKAPRPLSISQASLSLGLRVNRNGFRPEVSGGVDFGIEKVGTGSLKASHGSETAIEFDGSFTFDPKLADARIGFAYKRNEWSAEGTLTIPPKRIPGVKRAKLAVSYAQGKFTADGDADLDVPVFQKGHVHLEHSEAAGLLIDARFDLKSDLPIVKGGFLAAKITRSSAGDWELGGEGQANLSLAGKSATLKGAYEKGIFDVKAEIPFTHGERVSGTITVGATNREFDKSGKPTGKTADKLHAYGGGTVVVMLVKPWLQGTVAVEIQPTGAWRVVGDIRVTEGVPITKPLLDKEKPLFKKDVDIELIQLIVAAVFVNIGGEVSAFAKVGALTLEHALFHVDYNPENEAETHVQGFAVIALNAAAGIRANLHLGAGARLLIVKAKVTGNVDLTAELAIVARLGAGLDWRPGKPIQFGGFVSLNAETVLTFGLYAAVDVYLDLLLGTIDLYEYKFPKKTLSYKPPLRVGAKLPIKYVEGQPFDIDVKAIEFTNAEFDAEKTFGDMFEHSRKEGAQEVNDE